MKPILKNSLIVIMILSLLLNILLFTSLGYVSIEYEDSCYVEILEWCEYSNDLSDLANDLFDNLEYYDGGYSEIDRFEALDCFNNE